MPLYKAPVLLLGAGSPRSVAHSRAKRIEKDAGEADELVKKIDDIDNIDDASEYESVSYKWLQNMKSKKTICVEKLCKSADVDRLQVYT